MFKIVKSLFTGKPQLKVIPETEQELFRNVAPIQHPVYGSVYPDPDEEWSDVPLVSGKPVPAYGTKAEDDGESALSRTDSASRWDRIVPNALQAPAVSYSPGKRTPPVSSAPPTLPLPAPTRPATPKQPEDSADGRGFYPKIRNLTETPAVRARLDSLIQMQTRPELPDAETGSVLYEYFPTPEDAWNYTDESGFGSTNLQTGDDSRIRDGNRVTSLNLKAADKYSRDINQSRRTIGFAHTHNRESYPSPSDVNSFLDLRNDERVWPQRAARATLVTTGPSYTYTLTVDDPEKIAALTAGQLEYLERNYYRLIVSEGYTEQEAFTRTYLEDPVIRGALGLQRTRNEGESSLRAFEKLEPDKNGLFIWKPIRKE